MKANLALLATALAAGSAMAHIEMKEPYSFRSKFNPDETNIDYSNKSPLAKDGSNFPCKGYQNDPLPPTGTYTAGGSGHLGLDGSTFHGGGSCQISVSGDGGATFKVIQSMMGDCPIPLSYDFPIPASVPSGDVLLAWTWFNLVGNREMYMNCAPVTIEGGATDMSEFEALPDLFTANIGNGCSTVENQHTVFANPGPNVIYGGDVTADSPPFPQC